MIKLSNMKIRTKIFTLLLLPLLLLLIGGGVFVKDKWDARRLAQSMSLNVACFQAASDLVAELQRERGRSVMFLSGTLTQSGLDEQRRNTDSRINAYRTALAASGLTEGQKNRYALEQLKISESRNEVGRSLATGPQVIARYSAKIEELTDLMSDLANTRTTGGIGKVLTSLLVVESAKENVGILRATLSSVIGMNNPIDQDRLLGMLRLKGQLDAGVTSKALALSGKNMILIREFSSRPHWREVDRVVSVVVARAERGGYEVDPSKFWGDISRVVDDLGELVVSEINNQLKRVESIESAATRSMTAYLVGFPLVLMLVLVVALFMAGRISRPIRQTADMLKEIATGDGDLTGRLDASSRDEMGDLARNFNHFVDKLQNIIAQISGKAGILTTSATDLSTVSNQTVQSVRTLSERTSSVAAAAEETSANTDSVAEGMGQATNSLSSVAGATEEMSATVSEIAGNTEKARRISEQAMQQAQGVTATMQSLGTAAREIDRVTETITEISSQTNLLALNATIEAARAGEAGKGFAVVAGEIKALARQTADATEDIKRRISGIQASTGSAVSDIDQINQVIREVGELVNSIAAAIEEQSVVTRDLAGNIAQVSAGVQDANERVAQTAGVSREMARDIAEVNTAAADIRSGGEQVQSSAAELSKLAEQLKQLVGQFKVE